MNAVADGRTDTDTVMEDVMQGVVESTTELRFNLLLVNLLWTEACN